jgi:glycosyltransferase involved in cell wall biosynthesis
LAETLSCLSVADRNGLDVEIVVVDNGSHDDTRAVVESFAGKLPVRYLFEARPGKFHALNRALDDAALRDVVAFLDDDMTPEPGWFLGVKAACDTWPNRDFFGGRTPVTLPPGPIPTWTSVTKIRGWAFSAHDHGPADSDIPLGEWPTPNNFWIRSRVLKGGRRFPGNWATEPQFLLELYHDGYRGIRTGSAIARHRIQPRLLKEEVIRARAVLVGRSLAAIRLRPYKATKIGSLVYHHPILARCACAAFLGLWSFRYLSARLSPSRDSRFAGTVWALERIVYFKEVLRLSLAMRSERASRGQSSECDRT